MIEEKNRNRYFRTDTIPVVIANNYELRGVQTMYDSVSEALSRQPADFFDPQISPLIIRREQSSNPRRISGQLINRWKWIDSMPRSFDNNASIRHSRGHVKDPDNGRVMRSY